MHKLAALALLALTTSATPTPALPTKITTADLLQAATELAQKYDTNYAAKNPAGMADLYTPDAVLIPTTGQVLRGRDAIRNFYSSRFANGAGNHQIRVVEVHVQGNGGYGLARFNATIPNANGELHTVSGTIVAIYQLDLDGWHISLAEPSLSQPAVEPSHQEAFVQSAR